MDQLLLSCSDVHLDKQGEQGLDGTFQLNGKAIKWSGSRAGEPWSAICPLQKIDNLITQSEQRRIKVLVDKVVKFEFQFSSAKDTFEAYTSVMSARRRLMSSSTSKPTRGHRRSICFDDLVQTHASPSRLPPPDQHQELENVAPNIPNEKRKSESDWKSMVRKYCDPKVDSQIRAEIRSGIAHKFNYQLGMELDLDDMSGCAVLSTQDLGRKILPMLTQMKDAIHQQRENQEAALCVSILSPRSTSQNGYQYIDKTTGKELTVKEYEDRYEEVILGRKQVVDSEPILQEEVSLPGPSDFAAQAQQVHESGYEPTTLLESRINKDMYNSLMKEAEERMYKKFDEALLEFAREKHALLQRFEQ